jgi:hypothetical protein
MNLCKAARLTAAAVAVIGVFALGLGQPRAVPLQDLLDGGSIIVDDKLFADWELEFLDYSDGDGPDLSLIEVTPWIDDPMNPGLLYTANDQLTVEDDNFIDLGFNYTVWILPEEAGHLSIVDNSLELLGFNFGEDENGGVGGLIEIFESVFTVGGEFLGEKYVFADNLFGDSQLFDELEFEKIKHLFIEKEIFISGDLEGDIVELETFAQHFSQIDEPPTVALLAIGLLGLAAMALRRRKELQAA